MQHIRFKKPGTENRAMKENFAVLIGISAVLSLYVSGLEIGEVGSASLVYSAVDSTGIFLTDITVPEDNVTITGFRFLLNTQQGVEADHELWIQVYRPLDGAPETFTLISEASVSLLAQQNGEYTLTLTVPEYMPVQSGDRLAFLNKGSYVPIPYSLPGQTRRYAYGSTRPALNQEVVFPGLNYPIKFSMLALLTNKTFDNTTPESQTVVTSQSEASTKSLVYPTTAAPVVTNPPKTTPQATAEPTTAEPTTGPTTRSTTDVGVSSTLPWCQEQMTVEPNVSLCQTIAHGCSHQCIDAPGSFYCACPAGYQLNTMDNKTCIDIQVCSDNNGFCQHVCNNATGLLECACRKGYSLSEDAHSCIDVDECLVNSTCTSDEICVNLPGSHVCLPATSSHCPSRVGLSAQNRVGLISEPTFIGFIVWLILLTIITLALLSAVCVRSRSSKGTSLSAYTGTSACYEGPYNPKEEERTDRERIARLMEMKYPVLYGTSHIRTGNSL